jgi:two-component system nitrogen regulation sensor histidine kinase NtrY
MTFRTRLLWMVTLAVVVSVGLVEWMVTGTTRDAFERAEAQRVNALVAQFRREFARRGEEVDRAIGAIAGSETALNIALASDYAPYYNEASTLASANGLDLLELVAGDGSIISSAEWPARFGYKEDWLVAGGDWQGRATFLRREELADGPILALVAVGEARAGDRRVYVTGGQRLDRAFLSSLVLPEGMRVVLYLPPNQLIGPLGSVPDAKVFAPLVADAMNLREFSRVVGAGSSAEIVHAIPLIGAPHELFGALFVASSRRDLVQMETSLRDIGVALGVGGILVGIALSWWATARVTRPVRVLAESAQKVAAGNWDTTVEAGPEDEIGQLARAFNRMTQELVAQRERLVQAERVAAWRELARRLAHELKNPLFPLQITVENMQRARVQAPEQFDEVFREGTGTLLAELANLKQIIGRFSDFSKMPAPQKQTLDVNHLVADTLKFFEPQFALAHIAAKSDLDPRLPAISADPEQMARVLRNLVLNAIDAMPQGGALLVKTAARNGGIRMEVSDTGQGLTPEECDRLFTPYYTTKTHGTGLGLAIVQSVISDHQGRIWAESQPGKGTAFRIDLG